MKFVNMGNRPLNHDVRSRKTIVIPKGTRNVEIAFRQSHLTRFDKESGRIVKLNVYRYNGKTYHD